MYLEQTLEKLIDKLPDVYEFELKRGLLILHVPQGIIEWKLQGKQTAETWDKINQILET